MWAALVSKCFISLPPDLSNQFFDNHYCSAEGSDCARHNANATLLYALQISANCRRSCCANTADTVIVVVYLIGIFAVGVYF